MSIILAIDTSADIASVALLRGTLLTTRASDGAQSHSQVLVPMVQQLLSEAGLTVTDCDAIAFGAGPGSFTGVRTACGVAQGLGFGAGCRILPVSTLAAMALACHEVTGASSVVPLLDARMGEVYWAQYDFTAGLSEICAPALALPVAVLPRGTATACGNGLTVYATQFHTASWLTATRHESMPHAEQIARLALHGFQRGQAMDARSAQPIYLRNNVALTTRERQEKKLQEAV